MNVIMVSPGGRVMGGGMGTVTRNICDYLSSSEDVNVKVIDSRGEIGVIASGFFFFIALCQFVVCRLACRGEVVLHVNVSERLSFYRKALFVVLGRLTFCRVILHHHGAEFIEWYRRSSVFSKYVVRFCVLYSHVNIVLGDVWKVFLEDEFGGGARVVVLHNAVPDHRNKLRRDQDGELQLLFLGNLTERKGVSLLLEAVSAGDV